MKTDRTDLFKHLLSFAKVHLLHVRKVLSLDQLPSTQHWPKSLLLKKNNPQQDCNDGSLDADRDIYREAQQAGWTSFDVIEHDDVEEVEKVS